MGKYKIAGVCVDMSPKYKTLSTQSADYLVADGTPADFAINLSDEYLAFKQSKNQHLSIDDCEYVWYGFEFYKKLPEFGGIMLHSSCIAVDGSAYLFSAPCGTGKSTHTTLWKEYFGEKAIYVNDDKPALKISGDGKVYACGTPFSGKTDLNNNVSFPVKGICVLERGQENSIKRLSTVQAIPKFLNQTFRPYEEENMKKTLSVLSDVFLRVPVYKLICNISFDAVKTAYEGMNKE